MKTIISNTALLDDEVVEELHTMAMSDNDSMAMAGRLGKELMPAINRWFEAELERGGMDVGNGVLAIISFMFNVLMVLNRRGAPPERELSSWGVVKKITDSIYENQTEHIKKCRDIANNAMNINVNTTG